MTGSSPVMTIDKGSLFCTAPAAKQGHDNDSGNPNATGGNAEVMALAHQAKRVAEKEVEP
jgi:hypothetical protein